ncbi:hypothetical protein NMY22_g12311 [Coprinellus aureogranulatus]|nr:hypothetical protein NMY22_g12311 [Coprinellus aureogranulatus]
MMSPRRAVGVCEKIFRQKLETIEAQSVEEEDTKGWISIPIASEIGPYRFPDPGGTYPSRDRHDNTSHVTTVETYGKWLDGHSCYRCTVLDRAFAAAFSSDKTYIYEDDHRKLSADDRTSPSRVLQADVGLSPFAFHIIIPPASACYCIATLFALSWYSNSSMSPPDCGSRRAVYSHDFLLPPCSSSRDQSVLRTLYRSSLRILLVPHVALRLTVFFPYDLPPSAVAFSHPFPFDFLPPFYAFIPISAFWHTSADIAAVQFLLPALCALF